MATLSEKASGAFLQDLASLCIKHKIDWNGGVIVASEWGGTVDVYSRSVLRKTNAKTVSSWPEGRWFVAACLRELGILGPAEQPEKTSVGKAVAAAIGSSDPDFLDS